MNRSAEAGFADSFDELNQGGSFQRSARATHQDDQAGERRVADQRQEVVAIACHQNVVVGVRVAKNFVVGLVVGKTSRSRTTL